MRYAQTKFLLATLVGLLWAQQYRYGPLVTGKPSPELVQRITEQIKQANIPPRSLDWEPLEPGVGNLPALRVRTNVLGVQWVSPHQDVDTVRKTDRTMPFVGGLSGVPIYVGGDTIMASGVGADIPSENVADPSRCNHLYFDSMVIAGLYTGGFIYSQGPLAGRWFLMGGSPIYPAGSEGNKRFYIGGGAAQRYKFNFAGVQDFYVKGIAAFISKNRGTPADQDRRCRTLTPNYDTWDGDDVPEAVFFIGTVDTVTWEDYGVGTYISSVIARETVAVQNLRYASFPVNNGQCVAPQRPMSDIIGRFTERFHYTYFSSPVRIGPPTNPNPTFRDSMFYFGIIFDRRANPEIATPLILDSIFIPIGPAARGIQTWAEHPCRHDTLYYLHLGRTMIMFNQYDVNTGWDTVFFYPERMLWADREDYMLDYPIFPIVRVVVDPSASVGKPVVSNDILGFSAPYPNPATDCVHLGVELMTEGRVTLSFYDAKGQLLKEVERSLPAGTSQVAVDVGDLPAGAYILMVRSSIGGGASFWLNIVK